MSKFNIILVTFIFGIVGLILIMSLADSNYANTNTVTITNGQFTMDNTTCDVVSSGNCIVSVTSITNKTSGVAIPSTNYTICRHGGNPDGIQFFGLNSNYSKYNGETINITYAQSIKCQYVDDATSRNILPIIIILFAIAILMGVGYWMFQKGAFDF